MHTNSTTTISTMLRFERCRKHRRIFNIYSVFILVNSYRRIYSNKNFNSIDGSSISIINISVIYLGYRVSIANFILTWMSGITRWSIYDSTENIYLSRPHILFCVVYRPMQGRYLPRGWMSSLEVLTCWRIKLSGCTNPIHERDDMGRWNLNLQLILQLLNSSNGNGNRTYWRTAGCYWCTATAISSALLLSVVSCYCLCSISEDIC